MLHNKIFCMMGDGRINSKASSSITWTLTKEKKNSQIFQWQRNEDTDNDVDDDTLLFTAFSFCSERWRLPLYVPFIQVEYCSISACKTSYIFFNPFMIFSVYLSPTLHCKCEMVYGENSVQFIFSLHINMLSGCYHISHFTNLLQMRWTSAMYVVDFWEGNIFQAVWTLFGVTILWKRY